MLTEQYDGDGEEAQKQQPFRNKNKVLILSSRGIGYRIRHLMQDFIDLCPHAKKDVKIAEKSRLESVNEVCEMKGCNLAMFFEARKGKDFYLWLARSPDGPSMKFHMLNSKLPARALGSQRAVAVA
jgi:ribosome biogenesis protein BRX1